jgi:hypothetical protein
VPGDDQTHVDLIAELQEEPREPVADLPRAPLDAEPPVPGAQWDELHHRWEAWDEARQQWVVVGDGGDPVDPAEENPLPPLLARELQHAEDLEAAEDPDVVDVARAPEPPGHVPGAQWNEVVGRWERWDEAAGAWVEVPAE